MGISFSELIVIFVVFLILFGPEKLPQIFAQIGKLAGEIKKQSDSIRREFYNSVYKPAEDLQSEIDFAKRTLTAVKTEVRAAAETPKIAASEISAEGNKEKDSEQPA